MKMLHDPRSPKLYHIWQDRLAQLTPDNCRSRLANMLLLVVGIYRARSVHLSLVARKLPVRAKKLSLDKRLRRFLANNQVRVREWYSPVARNLLQAASSAGQIHLLIDCTKVGAGHQLLMVAIAFRRRALPLAWTWVQSSKGYSTTHKQLALLSYVLSLMPEEVSVSLVGDSEFGNMRLLHQLDDWGWEYSLRQRGSTRFMPYRMTKRYRLDRQPVELGDKWWLGRVDVTHAHYYVTNLVFYWAHSEPEPWYLATNLPSPQGAIQLYRRRMWIEEMFGDIKGHGFDLEASCLRHFLRLSRLTLAVCLLYLWLVAIGERVMAINETHEVDRTDRRDLSIFRVGWDFIERKLVLNDPIPIVFTPNFCSVSGG